MTVTAPSSESSGWSPPATSMMASRVCASVAGPARRIPSPSGPRCRSASSMRWGASWPKVPAGSRSAAMPHMSGAASARGHSASDRGRRSPHRHVGHLGRALRCHLLFTFASGAVCRRSGPSASASSTTGRSNDVPPDGTHPRRTRRRAPRGRPGHRGVRGSDPAGGPGDGRSDRRDEGLPHRRGQGAGRRDHRQDQGGREEGAVLGDGPHARRLPLADGPRLPVATRTEGPREAIKSVGLSQKQVWAIATGSVDCKDTRKLAPLAERVRANGGAPQWTRGKYLAATLVARIEAKLTLRDLAAAAFVLAALLYGQLDNGDHAQEPQGVATAPSR